MPEIQRFQGFFSYAHHDAESDPKLVEALTKRLEMRVSGRMTNARFEIWKDTGNLRTGDKWDDRIAEAISRSRVFIILITPKWFESDYCRREFELFQQLEDEIDLGEYIVPLLARSLERQIENFDPMQKQAYDRLKKRQYRRTIASDFLTLTEDQREHFVDEIADDIDGMVQRLRRTQYRPGGTQRATATKFPPNTRARSTMRPHNLVDVDFVSAAEVLVDPPNGHEQRGVFAHISFVEQLYVETKTIRVEFSIRRAYLSIDDGGSGKLSRNEAWANLPTNGSVYYVNYKPAPQAITVCINAPPSRNGIADLPLPAEQNQNYLSKPAVAAADIDAARIRATLTISLSPEGLYVAGDESQTPSPAFAKKIAAIMSVVVTKSDIEGDSGMIRRNIPVRERT